MAGDCTETMGLYLADKSVNCCVTSPPYFGLRDYGHAGQIGLEPTPDEFVAKLVEVFREVRRVLRDDGTLWLNLGDSYASGGRKSRDPGKSKIHPAFKGDAFADGLRPDDPEGIKQKDLLGIPWRVAFALQQDGWYLRQDIIWHKPNPMPESVRDRCTKAHEYIFLLSKSPKYYFDWQAMQEPATNRPPGNKKPTKGGREYLIAEGEQHRTAANLHHIEARETRNRRSVWTVTTKPFRGAHFATFPPDLIEPCVLAGCPAGGTVLDPFGGAGTTALVATRHNRKSFSCEMNPAYVEMAEARLRKAFP
ncbi:MAG: site-specific DNA-methyltransferase [Candidatus Nanopelagicales bacterium]